MPRTEEQFKKMREKTSGKIIDAALKLFSEKGFHGTSINDIAKEAGISKGLIYNYFESKYSILEGIFSELLEIGEEIEHDTFLDDNPFEQLKRMINRSFKYVEDNPTYWKLIANLMLQPDILQEIKQVLNDFNERVTREMVGIFRKIGIKNAPLEARILGGMIDGVFLHYLFDMENYPLARVKKMMIQKYSRENLENLVNQK